MISMQLNKKLVYHLSKRMILKTMANAAHMMGYKVRFELHGHTA